MSDDRCAQIVGVISLQIRLLNRQEH